MPISGNGEIIYTCALTSTEVEAKARAEATHEAFQAGLTKATAGIAARMQSATLKASTTGDRSDLQTANAAYLALSRALRADLWTCFTGQVDTTLQPTEKSWPRLRNRSVPGSCSGF